MLLNVNPAHRSVRRRNESASGWNRPGFLAYGLLIAALAGALFPFYWAFITASNDPSAIYAEYRPLIPGTNLIPNIIEVIDSTPFWKALYNSVVVATVVSLSVVFFSTLAGFSFAKLRFRGREGLLVAVVATMAVPTQLSIVPLFIAMAEFGWTGTLWAVMVPNLVTAFGVFWMTQYFRGSLPYELIESARVDGCSMIRVFWHVGLPAARPAAAMLGLFTFVGSWTNFLWPLIVLEPGNPTLPVALANLQSEFFVDYSLVMTGVLLGTAPLVVLFFIAGRQLVAGIMAGAVKG